MPDIGKANFSKIYVFIYTPENATNFQNALLLSSPQDNGK
jgi:hypothetical protein